MDKLVLSGQEAISATCGDSFIVTLIQEDIVGEWRWGNIYEAIVKDADDKFWGVTYQIQTGDNYHHQFEDEDTVEFYPVEAKEVTTVTYVRIKD